MSTSSRPDERNDIHAGPAAVRLRAVGVVLAGGRSRRMGVDKATLRLADGRTLAELVDDALAGACDDVIVAGPEVVLPHRRHVVDATPDSGPLAGIEAALGSCGAAHIVAVPCDMPRLTPALLARLLEPTDAAITIFDDGSGAMHALPARIAVSALPVVRQLLERRELAVRRLLAHVGAHRIVVDEMEVPQLANVNTPDELAMLDRA